MAFLITKPIDEIKNETKLRINELSGKYILLRYPIYRQLNFHRLPTNPETLAMYTYIDSVRDLSNVTTNSITLAITVTQIREIENTFTTSLLSI